MPKITKYKNKDDYSFSLGAYPTLELIKYKPEILQSVYVRQDAGRNQGVQKVLNHCRKHQLPVVESSKTIERISGKANVYCMGLFSKYQPRFDPAVDHVVLYQVADPGNVGTIIRAMQGFGIDHLALVGGGVDIFHPRLVRASMGSLFAINFQHYPSLANYVQSTSNHVYLMTGTGVVDLKDLTLERPASLVFGSEAGGIPSEFHQFGTTVRIPQSQAIDSLNISVAVGIVLYEASIKR